MAFAPHHLAYAFEAQGELGFTFWTYATNDTLRDVLTPDYFASMCRRMRLGDLVLVGIRPRPASDAWLNVATEFRRVLLMVSAVDAGGRLAMRLVQDYGRPEDADAPIQEPPKKRGRPSKETSRKPGTRSADCAAGSAVQASSGAH